MRNTFRRSSSPHAVLAAGRFSRLRALSLAALMVAGAGAALPVAAREGVEVGKASGFSRLVPAEQVEAAAAQQYVQMQSQARQQNALAPANHPQVIRLKAIAQRIIPHTDEWNPRARQWQWEVALLQSKDINAFCMPGGKIAFYTGILDQLKLTDDEVAMIMGHEMAHALREHARERMGKTAATRLGANVLSGLLGLGNAGDTLLNMGGQLLTLKFGREDESEADLVGMELAARAGYDPRAGVTLWRKMAAAAKGAPPQFLSTHPSSSTRIQEIQAALPRVLPLYQRAGKPDRRFDAPLRTGQAQQQTFEPLAYWGGGRASTQERGAVPPGSHAGHSHPHPHPQPAPERVSSRDANGGWVRVTP